MKKKVLIGVGGILLVLVVFIWQVVANLDSIVAGVIEDVSSDVLQTKVTVADVSIRLKEGKAGIGGLSIANPEGYSKVNLFKMEGVEVNLDLESLGKDVLVIESVRVRNPRVLFEGDANGGSNMQTLLDNIASMSGGDRKVADGKAIKMIIERFEFSGGRVKATTALMRRKSVQFKLPTIKMSDIGRAEGGVTADVVVQRIAGKLTSSIMEASLKALAEKALKDKKKNLQDVLGAVLREQNKN